MAGDAGLGNKSYVGLNFETAWGTKNTDLTAYDGDGGQSPWIDINSCTLPVEERPLRASSLTGISPLYNKVVQGPRGITGDVRWNPNYNAQTLNRLFYLAMGHYFPFGPIEMQYRPSAVLPSCTLEAHMDKQAIRYYGGKVTQLRGTVSPDSFFELTTSFIFRDFDEISYVNWETISFDGASRDEMIRSDDLSVARYDTSGTSGGVLLDIATVRDFEFFIDNRLNPDRRALGSRLIKEPDRTDRLSTGGRAVIEFDDSTFFYQFYNQFVGQMLFTFVGGDTTGSSTNGYELRLDWPRARISTGTPVVNAFGIITLEVEWEGLRGVDGDQVTDPSLIVSISNDQAMYGAKVPAPNVTWT